MTQHVMPQKPQGGKPVDAGAIPGVLGAMLPPGTPPDQMSVATRPGTDWAGCRVQKLASRSDNDTNRDYYFNIALVPEGKPLQKAHVVGYGGLLVDDVGKKGIASDEIEAIIGQRPTMSVNSSPGNCQWFYGYTRPATQDEQDEIEEHRKRLRLGDHKCWNNRARWGRLPFGKNSKHGGYPVCLDDNHTTGVRIDPEKLLERLRAARGNGAVPPQQKQGGKAAKTTHAPAEDRDEKSRWRAEEKVARDPRAAAMLIDLMPNDGWADDDNGPFESLFISAAVAGRGGPITRDAFMRFCERWEAYETDPEADAELYDGVNPAPSQKHVGMWWLKDQAWKFVRSGQIAPEDFFAAMCVEARATFPPVSGRELEQQRGGLVQKIGAVIDTGAQEQG